MQWHAAGSQPPAAQTVVYQQQGMAMPVQYVSSSGPQDGGGGNSNNPATSTMHLLSGCSEPMQQQQQVCFMPMAPDYGQQLFGGSTVFLVPGGQQGAGGQAPMQANILQLPQGGGGLQYTQVGGYQHVQGGCTMMQQRAPQGAVTYVTAPPCCFSVGMQQQLQHQQARGGSSDGSCMSSTPYASSNGMLFTQQSGSQHSSSNGSCSTVHGFHQAPGLLGAPAPPNGRHHYGPGGVMMGGLFATPPPRSTGPDGGLHVVTYPTPPGGAAGIYYFGRPPSGAPHHQHQPSLPPQRPQQLQQPQPPPGGAVQHKWGIDPRLIVGTPVEVAWEVLRRVPAVKPVLELERDQTCLRNLTVQEDTARSEAAAAAAGGQHQQAHGSQPPSPAAASAAGAAAAPSSPVGSACEADAGGSASEPDAAATSVTGEAGGPAAGAAGPAPPAGGGVEAKSELDIPLDPELLVQEQGLVRSCRGLPARVRDDLIRAARLAVTRTDAATGAELPGTGLLPFFWRVQTNLKWLLRQPATLKGQLVPGQIDFITDEQRIQSFQKTVAQRGRLAELAVLLHQMLQVPADEADVMAAAAAAAGLMLE